MTFLRRGALLLSVLSLVGCGGSGPKRRAAARDGDGPTRHASSPEARWRALTLSHKAVTSAIGGHRFRGRHAVRVTFGGKPDRALTDTYELRCRRSGDCYGKHHNSREYGVEFYRLGDLTYFRNRYQRFLRFEEEPEEAERRIEHIWGHGAATLRLVRRRLAVARAGSAKAAGREGVRYRLSRSSAAKPVSAETRRLLHRRWRRQLEVVKVSGEVIVDAKTGVPLRMTIDYEVRAHKRDQPVVIAGSHFQELGAIGEEPKLTPPMGAIAARGRPRPMLDVKRLIGKMGVPLYPGWFRGGGPQRRGGRQPAPRGGSRGMVSRRRGAVAPMRGMVAPMMRAGTMAP